jgi:putative ABC transport system substrate-binding protein
MAFRQGLNESGYIEGQNVTIEFRWADGEFDRLTTLAADLVARQAAVIFAGGVDVRIREINAAISRIPVVFATAGDPVELGLVASLNRPGGNATAVTIFSAPLGSQRLALLREVVSPATRIALLVNPRNATTAHSLMEVQAAANGNILVLNATAESGFDAAFAELVREGKSALIVANDTLFFSQRKALIALAALYKVPAIYDRRDYAVDGGLMSYGAGAADQYRESARYVGRVLQGTTPADLPVLQPTKFELIINLKTSKALDLRVPESFLLRADEVIE